MEQGFQKLASLINTCILSKLSREYYENDIRPEFHIRNVNLTKNFQEIIYLLEQQEFTQNSDPSSNTLCHLIILYFELLSIGPWNTEDTGVVEKLGKLNNIFIKKYNIQLCEVFTSELFESQIIFDKCIRELHKNVTADNLKKYPSLIGVYCLLINNLKSYKIDVNPVTVLPIALLLIDDYVISNKIKGLQSCTAILQCLTTKEFIVGNYYEVVYSSLKKNILEKDKEVTQVLFECFMEFLKIMPSDIKKKKLDDIFSNVIDQLHTESNVYRKALFFDFITKIIKLHGIHCVKKKVNTIIRDNLDSCCDETVSEILLQHVLECLQTWIRYCWCTWILSEGNKMLSSLFKILYLSKDEMTGVKIRNIIITLIKLGTEEEQLEVLEKLQEPIKCTNLGFLNNLEIIKQEING